jgi:hypothetical protein
MLDLKQAIKAGETHDSCRAGAVQRRALVYEFNKLRVEIMRCNKSGSASAPPQRRTHASIGSAMSSRSCLAIVRAGEAVR